MNKRKLLKMMRKEDEKPEIKKRRAYHEAGHAAILWMFDDAASIQFISMIGTLTNTAFIRRRGIIFPNLPRVVCSPAIRRFEGVKWMMYTLAGYAVENRMVAASAARFA